MPKRFRSLCVVGMLALVGLLFPFPAARSVFGQVGTSQDTISPWPILTLSARTGALPGSVELEWTAPGDDGSTGTATAYVVRYNTVPITEDNWDSSLHVAGEPIPSPAGSAESMTVVGLPGGQRYHFALKTEDEVPNASGVSNSPSAVAQAGPNVVSLPMVSRSFEEPPPVIPDTTETLSYSTTQYLEAIADDMAFTFSQSTPELEALEPGDIMVGDVAPSAPHGFLRKVTSTWSPGDGVVVVETEPTTLEEAIDTGSFHVTQPLTPGQVRSAHYADGVNMAPSPDGVRFELSLKDVVLYDDDEDLRTKYDQITVDGTLSLELDGDFGLQIKWFRLKKLWFSVSATQTAEIAVKCAVPLDLLDKEKPIAEWKLSDIRVMVGPVPVVIEPKITLSVGVNGQVSVGISTGVTQQAGLTLGAAYESGHWSPISDFDLGFQFNPPEVYASASLRGWIGGELEMMLYGALGPYVGVRAFLELEATISKALDVALYAGLELYCGAKVEILGITLEDYESPPIDFRVLIAQFAGNNPPDAPSNPIPLDDAADEPLNALLLWTGGDLDGDAVTYDVYLEANDPYPDVKVSSGQSGTSYDAGMLAANTDYFWRVVAQDDEGATSPGLVWSFRTGTSSNQLPDLPSSPSPPDGATEQLIYLELTWTGGDDDGDQVTYDVYLEADDDTPDVTVCDDADSAICDPGVLLTSTLYYWQAVPRDEHGRTNQGEVWDFATGISTNRPPVVSNAVWPYDGDIRQNLWTYLEWQASDPDYDPLTYDVYLEADDGTPDVLVCDDLPDPRCEPGVMNGNTRYYWQVVARDDEGATTLGPVWMFTTADMVYVAEGEFQMGCDSGNHHEQCSNADELPLHPVYLSAYAIDRTEVTNAEYAECMQSSCTPPLGESSRTHPNYFGNPEFADYPVLWITYAQATEYCFWAAPYYGGGTSWWELPTEAQWEKAARGGLDTRKYPWGSGTQDCSRLNYYHWDGLAYDYCVGDTARVGDYPSGASPYGALDMSGNVREWVKDWYGSDYYGQSPYEDPEGPEAGAYRVVRGGGWLDTQGDVRTARRSYAEPGEASDGLGFRCAVGQPYWVNPSSAEGEER